LRIEVSWPLGYEDTDEPYPVLYLLDGYWFFPMISQSLQGPAHAGELPHLIVVGIGYEPEGSARSVENERVSHLRCRDLTPTRDDTEWWQAAAGKPLGIGVETGHAATFLEVIEKDITPFIQQHYRVDCSNQVLGGFSLGGLFALFALFTRPGSFSGYIAASPSLWWGSDAMFRIEDEYARSNSDLPTRLFLSMGALEEGPGNASCRMVSNLRRFADMLVGRRYPSLRLESKIFEGHTHATGVVPAFLSGVASVFRSETVPPAADEVVARDGRRIAFVRGHDLYIRDTATDRERRLTWDGAPGHDYRIGDLDAGALSESSISRMPAAFFSPDSRKLLAFRIDLRDVDTFHVMESSCAHAPRVHSYRYPMAGARVGSAIPMVFDVETGSRTDVQIRPLPMASPISTLWSPTQTRWGETIAWNTDGTHVYFMREERGYKRVDVLEADTRTGEVRLVFSEETSTYLNRNPVLSVLSDREIIWSSERDGWNHLYLFDIRSAALRQLTVGTWAVRALLYVDAQRRWLYFTAGGREKDRDPYLRHLYRVTADGTELQLLTPEDADHEIIFSASGDHFVDNYSRLDLPPVTVRRAVDGQLLETVECRSSASRTLHSVPPEPFRAVARDGHTPIYGAIFRPANFDASRRYPVIDAIYPGPQIIRTRKRFLPYGDSSDYDQALADLGFIVVTLDGMGTPFRSRAFREVSYGNLGDAGGLEDHIAALSDLASRYSHFDLDRVGIWGISGGGYAAARALLKFPQFYKVAVAVAGNHDLLSFWSEWGERFQGFPVDVENYRAQSNAPLASQLEGRLLLAHGMLDDIVHPSQTLLFAEALRAAGKDFELHLLPNRNHRLVDVSDGRRDQGRIDLTALRQLWGYFVRHLQEPR
jgi:dipeptidyl aminopeptidase/acylaminoacyl peptidase